LQPNENNSERVLDALKAAESSFRGIGWHKTKALFGKDIYKLFEEIDSVFVWLQAWDKEAYLAVGKSNYAADYVERLQFIFSTARSLPEHFSPYLYFGNYKAF
jgi:hypothetical protein